MKWSLKSKYMTDKQENKNTLLSGMGSRSKEILAIALPAIVSNITTPLLGLVDTAIVGHLGSATLIGAIAVGSNIFSMVYWIFGFLRAGVSGLTAHAFGRKDADEMSAQLWRALCAGAFIAFILLLCAGALCRLMLWFISPEPDTALLAADYFNIVIYGAPAAMCTFGLSGWLLGMQNSRALLWIALVTNVVNIATSFTLVFGFRFGITGVALGTLVSQWAGFIFGLVMAISKYHPKRIAWRVVLDAHRFLEFARINADVFLRTLCLVAVTLWFIRIGANQGDNVLAANAILMQLFMFYSYFTDGFAYAGEALAGKYKGQGDDSLLRLSVRTLARWSAVVALMFVVLYFFAGETIVSFLTDDADVRLTAREYLLWIVTVPLVGTTAFMYDGIFIGLTRTRELLLTMFASALLFFGVYFLLFPSLGNHGLWIAFLSYLALRGASLWLLWHKRKTPAGNNVS